ncbi:hypothetical protein N0375_29435 [Pseudomonas aeruginosa]|uniref:hypothetical protein n=1 Tax=Pseudomonas aeruginosa TaxID=287 RepID=UPI00114395D8|nr:hypothetical protein [Pseudomonas aeruginosa]ELY1884195.1 hypothetical protein [Pseudomonas aeruginosa]MCK1185891.1 hypothetical protein [Pseudomonas aeruginosa]MCS7548903.1 hypothetical protein [Pseudomonas aeruginosa]TWW34431.1 hypothetical protein FSB80_28710 [Pseudomonas aeruginosa]TWX96843.1 hypothetical protein FS694_26505 [Pseudomonas aeruginosa]
MATAKERQQQSRFICLVVGFVALIPLLMVSFWRYSSLKSQYPEDEHSQRVFDTGNLVQPFATSGAVLLISWVFVAWSSQARIAVVLVPVLLVCALFVLFKMAQSISSTYFGVLVDPINDRVLLPKDMANYSASDYLNFKFVTDLGTMEEVPLSQIRRITRQGGKQLFIHGKFGSRGMKFSNKQKRDECLSAIEEGSSAAVSLEFERA